jgi:hypothetical protein
MLFNINKMSSENDASILPETVVSQSEANGDPVASNEAVTQPLVSPVSVPSSARLENVQSAYAKSERVVTQTASAIALQCAVCSQLQSETDKLVIGIEDLVQGGQLTMLNIIDICLSLMTMAENIHETTGPQRKQIVLQSVTMYLQKSGGDANLVNLLPPFIDAAIALEKGDTRIATQEAVTGCMGCLGFCLSKGSKRSKGSQK